MVLGMCRDRVNYPWLSDGGHFVRPLRVFCRLYCCLPGALKHTHTHTRTHTHVYSSSLLTSAALLHVLYVIRRIQQHLHVPHKSADLVHCGTFGVEDVAQGTVGHHLPEILRVHGRVGLGQQLLCGFQLAVLPHVLHHLSHFRDLLFFRGFVSLGVCTAPRPLCALGGWLNGTRLDGIAVLSLSHLPYLVDNPSH